MAENKTQETRESVPAFLDAVEHPTRREDAKALAALMTRVTGVAPRMWGPAIVGFGQCHYQYESGREGDMPRIGFSPRKGNLALYLTTKFEEYADLLARLGKHKTAVSCLYINRLADADLGVLEQMITRSWEASFEKYPMEAGGSP